MALTPGPITEGTPGHLGDHEEIHARLNAMTISTGDFASSTYPIQDAVAAAKAETASADSSRGAVVLMTGRSPFESDAPVVLPRTGSTPTSAVQLEGEGARQTRLIGVAGGTLVAGRALVEWEPVTSRAWHQRISGVNIVLPDVTGVRAVHFKRNGTGTTLTDFNNERLQIHMEDVLIEGNNDFHDSLCRFEGQVFYSGFDRVYGDCSIGTIPLNFDSTVLEFDTDNFGGGADSDIAGLSYSEINFPLGNVRRGGRHQILKGRVKDLILRGGFTDGSRLKPGIDLVNSFNVTIDAHHNEGRSAPQIQIADSIGVRLVDVFPSTQDPSDYPDWTASTAYAVNRGVVVPGWRTNTTQAAPANNNWYRSTVAGTTGASQPAWPTTLGATVVDGTVTWENMGPAVSDAVVLDGCQDVEVTGLRSTDAKPNFSSRGVHAIAFTDCTNVKLEGTVPGAPADEVGWTNTTGVARVRGARGGTYVTLGSDLYPAAAAAVAPIFLGAENFIAVTGAPTLQVINNTPGWSLDAAADEYVRTTTPLPSTWSTVKVETIWLNAGAGTGNVSHRVQIGIVTPGTAASGSATEVFAAAGAQNAPTWTTVATGYAVATNPQGLVTVQIGRRGTSGADTLPNDAHLIGVLLTKV